VFHRRAGEYYPNPYSRSVGEAFPAMNHQTTSTIWWQVDIHNLHRTVSKVFIISMRQYLERLIFILYSFSMRKTFYMQKSLKIPKGQSVYQRRIDNTMTKRKSTKGKTTIYKTLHIKHIFFYLFILIWMHPILLKSMNKQNGVKHIMFNWTSPVLYRSLSNKYSGISSWVGFVDNKSSYTE